MNQKTKEKKEEIENMIKQKFAAAAEQARQQARQQADEKAKRAENSKKEEHERQFSPEKEATLDKLKLLKGTFSFYVGPYRRPFLYSLYSGLNLDIDKESSYPALYFDCAEKVLHYHGDRIGNSLRYVIGVDSKSDIYICYKQIFAEIYCGQHNDSQKGWETIETTKHDFESALQLLKEALANHVQYVRGTIPGKIAKAFHLDDF